MSEKLSERLERIHRDPVRQTGDPMTHTVQMARELEQALEDARAERNAARLDGLRSAQDAYWDGTSIQELIDAELAAQTEPSK